VDTFQRNYFNDQTKYQFLLSRLRDKKDDVLAQREILGVLVRAIESDNDLMETAVKDEATRLLLELVRELKEPCEEIEQNCRIGLGELRTIVINGYC
jgi:hypothetical protein